MKPIKTLRFGAERGDFDYLYGEYKSLEEAKKSLKWEASLGQQFIVVNEDKEVDLYLWQGKDLEPLLVTPEEDEDGSGGNFNPNGANKVFTNFHFDFLDYIKVGFIDENNDNFYISNGADYAKFSYTSVSLFDSESESYVSLNPYTFNHLTNSGKTKTLHLEGEYNSSLLFPNSGVSSKVIPISVNNVDADNNGDIQLTPDTLISILQTATEAQKTQIKSLLGIS